MNLKMGDVIQSVKDLNWEHILASWTGPCYECFNKIQRDQPAVQVIIYRRRKKQENWRGLRCHTHCFIEAMK